jgi:hypothetical protein
LRSELQRSGWQPVISSDVAAYAPYVRVCIVILSPATVNDPAVTDAINANFPVLIPVLTEPMAVPYARWIVAPILIGAFGDIAFEATNAIQQVLVNQSVTTSFQQSGPM